MFVARNKNGDLYLFGSKPQRNEKFGFWSCGSNCIKITDNYHKKMFKNLQWNDDPEEVCLCLNNERYHTVKVEELDRLYEIDWNYSDMKETLETFEDRIQRYNSLPWYKRIFEKV